jgi:hypothetical protein
MKTLVFWKYGDIAIYLRRHSVAALNTAIRSAVDRRQGRYTNVLA